MTDQTPRTVRYGHNVYTEPTDQTPRTEAGRRVHCPRCGHDISELALVRRAKADALREAAERVRALRDSDDDIRDAVLAILTETER